MANAGWLTLYGKRTTIPEGMTTAEAKQRIDKELKKGPRTLAETSAIRVHPNGHVELKRKRRRPLNNFKNGVGRDDCDGAATKSD